MVFVSYLPSPTTTAILVPDLSRPDVLPLVWPSMVWRARASVEALWDRCRWGSYSYQPQKWSIRLLLLKLVASPLVVRVFVTPGFTSESLTRLCQGGSTVVTDLPNSADNLLLQAPWEPSPYEFFWNWSLQMANHISPSMRSKSLWSKTWFSKTLPSA